MHPSIALAVVLLLVPQLAQANCEAGGYSIHTVANYKESTPSSEIYLLYKVEGDRLHAKMNALDGGKIPLKGLPAPQSIRVGKKTCALTSGFSLDPKYTPDDPYSSEYPLSLPPKACQELLAKTSAQGYLRFDTAKKVLELPTPLTVTPLSPEHKGFQAIAEAIKKDALSRKLFLSTSPPGPGIKAEQIDGFRLEALEIGSGSEAFTLAIGLLRIKGLVSSFVLEKGEMSDADYKASVDAQRLKSGKADFPTIYFRPPGAAQFTFVGDGSNCSYVKFEKYEKPVDGAEGSFDRFQVTHAFDLNDDRVVDILEINGRFAYRLLSGGVPEVIHYGQGC